jgi:hypothetical protein
VLTGGICTQSAGFQADKMSIEDWNAALLEYCSSDFFFLACIIKGYTSSTQYAWGVWILESILRQDFQTDFFQGLF